VRPSASTAVRWAALVTGRVRATPSYARSRGGSFRLKGVKLSGVTVETHRAAPPTLPDEERSQVEVVRTNDLVDVAVRRSKMLPRAAPHSLRIRVEKLDSGSDESCACGCKRCDGEADNGPPVEEVMVPIIAGIDVRLGSIVEAESAARAAILDRRQLQNVSKER
jgi:hypothetical protein